LWRAIIIIIIIIVVVVVVKVTGALSAAIQLKTYNPDCGIPQPLK
jgi:hypothetical protein